MKALVVILCIGLIFISCKKTGSGTKQTQSIKQTPVTYQSEGVITGFNYWPCPFLECGGLQITIKDDPTENPPPYYLIYTTPPQLGITDSTKFPFYVSLTWMHDTTKARGSGDILVSQITVVK